MQNLFKRNLLLSLPSNVWSSISPDLNLCDYCLLVDVEKVSNARPYNSVAFLNTSVRQAFRTEKEESDTKAFRALRARIAASCRPRGQTHRFNCFSGVFNKKIALTHRYSPFFLLHISLKFRDPELPIYYLLPV